ncbi:hypothetical protein SAMN05192534_1245 [Alteribacillus persepolensis]|uniref:Uncharacterized protein n=1 Tax=Alteribacillus persepolensis TaxID=568899 RepID=A0A1G8IG83_9BACI|nr:hypothetical protein [Alteribacillus persepolensis]SDI17797.1 hypothetical protein SAMN05192534_1245 [Alteribacillus persepolensis]
MTDRELLEQLLQTVTNIDSKVTDMETELKTVNTDLSELKENQRQVQQAVLETNETTKRMEANQEKHERILDLLSRRSIEQEAEMKRIK